MTKTHNLKRRREASRKRFAERLRKIANRPAEQADNRRKLLASLDPETRKRAEKEFAQLGLTQ